MTLTKLSRKRLSVIIFVVLLCFLPAKSVPSLSNGVIGGMNGKNADTAHLTVQFPRLLYSIDTEAFAGTALEYVQFGEELCYIGDYAFSDVKGLAIAYIPESTSFIGINAFPIGTEIRGIKNSYAHIWADEYGFCFVEDDVWGINSNNISIRIEQFMLALCMIIPADNRCFRYKYRYSNLYYIKSMRPQDRSELYPINYRFP